MDAQKDLLCFDLMDFDMKNPVFPDKAATFIVTTTGIPTPTDQIPMFNGHYAQRIGTPNSFEAVTFYSDFLRVVNQRELTPAIKQIVIDFFDISFTYDPRLICYVQKLFNQSLSQVKDRNRNSHLKGNSLLKESALLLRQTNALRTIMTPFFEPAAKIARRKT